MPRKILIRTESYPYHVFNRSNNRDFFYIDHSSLWEIFLRCLGELEKQYHCDIHSFVLMSNHYHLIISTPQMNLGDAMKYLHREVARQANQLAGRINHFFGGRYKWSLITQELYYWNCIKYNFRNPVRAGIVPNVLEYTYSSLNKTSKFVKWKMVDFFQDREKTVELDTDWLNEPFLGEIDQGFERD